MRIFQQLLVIQELEILLSVYGTDKHIAIVCKINQMLNRKFSPDMSKMLGKKIQYSKNWYNYCFLTPFADNRSPPGCSERIRHVNTIIPCTIPVGVKIPLLTVGDSSFNSSVSVPVAENRIPAHGSETIRPVPAFHVPEPSLSRYQTPSL